MPNLTSPGLVISAIQFRAEMTFKKVRDLLETAKIPVILLKGPHLGATVYDSPKERVYADLDMLVKPGDFDIAAETLLANDFQPFAFNEFDPEVQRDFKHWEYRSPSGVIVELHRWLSGHDRYNVDIDGLFARAVVFNFGETQALGLGLEDLLLHLCLHMGTSYFHAIERKHITDIGMLIKKNEVNWPVFYERVKKAGAGAIAYYALLAAQRQEKTIIPDHVLSKLRPGKLRHWWLDNSIDATNFPVYRFPEHSIAKIKKRLLLPLMDRPGQWLGLLWRMAGTKMKILTRKKRQ